MSKAFVLGVAVAFMVVAPLLVRVPRAARPGRSVGPSVAYIVRELQGRQLVMIVVGSSQCGMSRGSNLVSSLLAVRDSLRMLAARRAVAFSSIGVALDTDARSGIEWLEQVGEFDEVSSGGSWLNTAMNEYVWSERSGMGAMPQVIVELRTVSRENDRRFRPPDHEVLIRMIGRGDILAMAGLHQVDALVTSRAAERPRGGL